MTVISHRSLLVRTLGRVYSGKAKTLSDLPDILEQTLEEDAWRDFVTEMGEEVRYEPGEFAKFLETPPLRGLGGNRETFLAILIAANRDKLVARVRDLLTMEPLGPAGRPSGNCRDTTITSKDASYLLRRLKRDAPGVAALVTAGEMSVNRAALQAGIRPPYVRVRVDDIDRALSKLIEFYTPDEIRGALKRAGR